MKIINMKKQDGYMHVKKNRYNIIKMMYDLFSN